MAAFVNGFEMQSTSSAATMRSDQLRLDYTYGRLGAVVGETNHVSLRAPRLARPRSGFTCRRGPLLEP